jgi:hypothetical protein
MIGFPLKSKKPQLPCRAKGVSGAHAVKRLDVHFKRDSAPNGGGIKPPPVLVVGICLC